MEDKTILVIIDPTSFEQPGLSRATALAQSLSAKVELFICHYDPDIAAGRTSTVWIENPAREHLMDILEKKLESLAGSLRERGINVETNVVWNHPLDEGILRKVSATNPWMVVKDTHHHNLLKRTILSNTDWSLIRHCPVPLLLVKLDPRAARPKICAAIDPTHEHDKPAALDDEIFHLAKTIADATGEELHVVHTVAVQAEPVGLEAPPVGKLTEAIKQERQRVLSEFLVSHPVPASNVHLLEGVAHERLVDFCTQQEIGMIVMGAVSRRGLGRIFIGSTAERALDRLPCDLLIAKVTGPVSERIPPT